MNSSLWFVGGDSRIDIAFPTFLSIRWDVVIVQKLPGPPLFGHSENHNLNLHCSNFETMTSQWYQEEVWFVQMPHCLPVYLIPPCRLTEWDTPQFFPEPVASLNANKDLTSLAKTLRLVSSPFKVSHDGCLGSAIGVWHFCFIWGVNVELIAIGTSSQTFLSNANKFESTINKLPGNTTDKRLLRSPWHLWRDDWFAIDISNQRSILGFVIHRGCL